MEARLASLEAQVGAGAARIAALQAQVTAGAARLTVLEEKQATRRRDESYHLREHHRPSPEPRSWRPKPDMDKPWGEY